LNTDTEPSSDFSLTINHLPFTVDGKEVVASTKNIQDDKHKKPVIFGSWGPGQWCFRSIWNGAALGHIVEHPKPKSEEP
jgi:hypothetical protein